MLRTIVYSFGMDKEASGRPASAGAGINNFMEEEQKYITQGVLYELNMI